MGKETLSAEMITCDLCGCEGTLRDFDCLYQAEALGHSADSIRAMPYATAMSLVCYICESCGDSKPIADVLRFLGLID